VETADKEAMKLKYDPEANAVYIRFCHKAVAKTRNAPGNEGNVVIDYAKDGSVVGVEVLGARQGVDLRGVPESDEVGELLRQSGFAAYQPGEWPPDWQPGKGRSPFYESRSRGG